MMDQIYERLMRWQEGDKALVFSNDMERNGKVILKEVELTKVVNKLAVNVVFWQRPEITEYTFKYYQDLKKRLSGEIELILCACGSEGDKSKKIAKKYGFNYMEYPNDSIQLKHDALWQWSQTFEADGYLKIDSDTIIDEKIFRHWDQLINKGYDYSGILDIYFLFQNAYCYFSGYEGKRKGESVGVGRFVSSRLMRLLNGQICGGAKPGICVDSWMTKRIEQHEIIEESIMCKEMDSYSVDIKSCTQLTDISNVKYDEVLSVDQYPFNFEKIKKSMQIYKTPSVSVIIPTMWKGKELMKMIKLYQSNDLISEVIIIDNAPCEIDLTSYSKVRQVTKGENIYVNPAWNWGARLSKSDIILIANDDIYVKEFDKLLNFVITNLQEGMIIGASESCYRDDSREIGMFKIKGRNWGFGTMMFMKRKDYTIIPDDLKIWCGDDVLIGTNQAFSFFGIRIETKMNTTVNTFRKEAEKDIDKLKKYDLTKLKKI
jgi:hypothetical protein